LEVCQAKFPGPCNCVLVIRCKCVKYSLTSSNEEERCIWPKDYSVTKLETWKSHITNSRNWYLVDGLCKFWEPHVSHGKSKTCIYLQPRKFWSSYSFSCCRTPLNGLDVLQNMFTNNKTGNKQWSVWMFQVLR
jgi:hypothetical protein